MDRVDNTGISEVLECYGMSQIRKFKKAKTNHLSTVTIAHLKTSLGATHRHTRVQLLRVLLDSGCSNVIVNPKSVEKLRKKPDRLTTWLTQAGSFKTSHTCKIQFTLPEFHKTKVIESQTISHTIFLSLG